MSGFRPASSSRQEDSSPLRRCTRTHIVVALVTVTALIATGLGVYFGVARNATKSDLQPSAASFVDNSTSITLESNDETARPIDSASPVTPISAPVAPSVDSPLVSLPTSAPVDSPVSSPSNSSSVASPTSEQAATPGPNSISAPVTPVDSPVTEPATTPINAPPVVLSAAPTVENPVNTLVHNTTNETCAFARLPSIPLLPSPPCAESMECSYIMSALDPVFPSSRRALLDTPCTCQHWTLQWMLSYSKDVMTFDFSRVRQRYTMALLYCEFDGDNWLDAELWASDLHECDWYSTIGVNPCSRNEEYQIIRNYGHQFRGTLPPEISMVSTLWEITLSDNMISGEIPPDFVKLSQLDTLALSFNLFEGPIPDFVWQFVDMTYLDLAYNFFTGTIPDYVHLTEPNLKVLFLENNDLSGSIPSTFGSLNWQRLHLDGNEFTGPVPVHINSPNLEELHLHSNKLTGEFPAESFANDNPGRSILREVTLYHNGDPDNRNASSVTGKFEVMCSLQYNPNLELLQVDYPTCTCCTGPP